MFEIAETREFRKLLARFPKAEQDRIRAKLHGFAYRILRANPYSGPNIRCLMNFRPRTRRYRFGPYRIFYEIHSQLVVVTAVYRRRDAY